MSRLIGAMEISQYAQRYNMPFEEDTPLTMAWCFDMVDAAERKGRTDATEEVKIEYKRMFNCGYTDCVSCDLFCNGRNFMDALEKLKEKK